ncbi:class I SAM-dependent methyltransferase [Tenacibaculum sp. TC6]|uniref:class I SAM-dependent methyltransferase n=1 Tax=Tenacibaculum sp. TC6 TaxID=3423223 RepID=UPI003D36D54A
MKKILLKKILLKLGLFPLFEQFNFQINRLKNKKKNNIFLRENTHISLPPDFYLYETFGLDYSRYYFGGAHVAKWIFNNFKKHIKFNPKSKILDWGCGPGRVIRHLPKIMGKENLYFGTDYNVNYIEWCTSNLTNIRFTLNQLSPPLKFEDNYFDAIYGISIFTHLSHEMHIKWIKELNRITIKSGILLITTHGESFIHKLNNHEQELFLNGQLVEHKYKKEGNRLFASYQPLTYFKNLCENNGFTVLEHIHGVIKNQKPQQDVWILKKTSNSS